MHVFYTESFMYNCIKITQNGIIINSNAIIEIMIYLREWHHSLPLILRLYHSLSYFVQHPRRVTYFLNGPLRVTILKKVIILSLMDIFLYICIRM